MDGDIIKQKLEDLDLLDDLPLSGWYTPLLGPLIGDPESDDLLNRYRKFAVGLRDAPEFIRDLICDKNWRPTLMGLTVVILLRAVEYQSDMAWRLANGNWVAPQLAVAIALVDEGRGVDLVRGIVDTATKESNAKVVMSAYSALSFLKSPLAYKFEASPLFEHLKNADSYDDSLRIAKRHWDFWKTIEPVP
jgi:hypothetical protein